MEGPERRWLVARGEDMPKLNALYRKRAATDERLTPDHNIPVIDARSTQVQLVASSYSVVESGGSVGSPGSPSAVTVGKVAGASYFYGPTVRGRAPKPTMD